MLLAKYLESPRIELLSKVAVVGEEVGKGAEGSFAKGVEALDSASADNSSSQKRHAVVARWRLVAPVSRSLLPWGPVVDVQGVTVYRLAGEEEVLEEKGALSSSPPPRRHVVVVRHTEAWDASPLAAVAQLLVPGGGGER